MSSVPALSADVLPDVAATLSGVPLQWEENRSSASLAELASVLTAAALEALQSAQQSASAQEWAEPYLAVNNRKNEGH
jgi:phosphoglycerate dehydrogenase-like enzyme